MTAVDNIARNIAVVGCGYWGQNLVRNMAETGALYAVSDYDAKRQDDFAAKYGVKSLGFDAVLADPAIEGVVLATPVVMHASMAIQALNAGKHVFVEKPISLSLDEAAQMNAAAAKSGKALMVGHLLQYHPVFLHLKSLVDDGALGSLQYIYSNRLNFGKIRTEENVLWSFATHDISMILALAGRAPSGIQAVYSESLPNSPASTATAFFDFGQGLTGHVHVSWLNPFKEQKLTVVGTKGMAVFDDTLAWDKKLAVFKNSVTFENGQPVLNKADAEYPVIPQAEPLREECLHFAVCVAGRHAPRTDGHEGTRVLKVLQECDKAALGAAALKGQAA